MRGTQNNIGTRATSLHYLNQEVWLCRFWHETNL